MRSHGYSFYTRGCRCRTCKAAKADYMAARRAASYVGPDVTPGGEFTHGTRFAYEERGCRCDPCVAAERSSTRYARRSAA